MPTRYLASVPFSLLLATGAMQAQGSGQTPMPRDYRGVQTHIDGLFVTPVPNAPFTADVQIVSHKKLPDGTEQVVTTINHVARSASGRIYNERRRLVPASYKGEPRLLSAHVYDPNSRTNVYLEPQTHLARQIIARAPAVTPPMAQPPAKQPTRPDVTETDLGMQRLDGVELHGTRKSRVVAAEVSGTGAAVTVVDDYWYSAELSIYMIIRHDDPRTGEQLVAVTKVERAEPPAERFAVPADYKVVDETPPPRTARILVQSPVEKDNPFPQ